MVIGPVADAFRRTIISLTMNYPAASGGVLSPSFAIKNIQFYITNIKSTVYICFIVEISSP